VPAPSPGYTPDAPAAMVLPREKIRLAPGEAPTVLGPHVRRISRRSSRRRKFLCTAKLRTRVRFPPPPPFPPFPGRPGGRLLRFVCRGSGHPIGKLAFVDASDFDRTVARIRDLSCPLDRDLE
jgi:hypothetical protein